MSVKRTRRGSAARAGRALVNFALVAVTLVCAAYLLPSLAGYERYVITGGSMSGTFEKGSIAFEQPVPVRDLAVGDVITYQPPRDSGVTNLVTHRIVERRHGRNGALVFRTQGDANPDPDPWTFSLVEGSQPVVEFTVPVLGYVFIALADRDLRMLVIGLPAALVALASLCQLAKALRERGDRGPSETPASVAGHPAAHPARA